MIILTADEKLASDFLFLTDYNNWYTSVILLTFNKKLAPDFPFLTADKNWHQCTMIFVCVVKIMYEGY